MASVVHVAGLAGGHSGNLFLTFGDAGLHQQYG